MKTARTKPQFVTPQKSEKSRTKLKMHRTPSTAGNLSQHRGCNACRNRPIPSEYAWQKLAHNAP